MGNLHASEWLVTKTMHTLFIHCFRPLLSLSLLGWPLLGLAQSESGPAVDPDLNAQIARYENQAASQNGTYNQSSAELYLSLANAYRAAGRYEDANFAFSEALQAVRINEGFASESQISILESHNVLLYEQQDWEQLDANYHLATDVAARLYGVGHVRYVETAEQLASWKIRAYQSGIYQGKEGRSIQEAAKIYRGFAEQLSGDEADYHQLMANYLSARGLAYFYSAQHVANIPVEEFRAVPQNGALQNCIPILLSIDGGAQPSQAACQVNQSSDPEYFASQQREKNNMVRGHLGNMRQSFAEAIEAIEANPASSLEDRAIAVLNYGDANLLAEDFARARTQYKRAYEMLSVNPETIQLRDSLMDHPAKALQGIIADLPFDSRLQDNVPLGSISFDVTARGEIKSINIEGPEGSLSQENIGAIAVKLDQSVYRPRIVDGRPVQSRITLTAADL